MNNEKCVICGRPVDDRFKPFCSKRCKNVDLQRWLGGHYRIETDELPDPDEPIPIDPDGS
jgi:endogenous inhibitor of DNA gyrase (YacG/DUF329 family)